MDPKASAKSKRTHSQQGRRNHPPPAASARKKQPSQPAGGEEQPRRDQSHNLPSNWDRYNSNDEEEGGQNLVNAKQVDVEVAPKSKGADFGYLIEQARSQPLEPSGPGIESSLFDEFTPDFMQGVSSMLSVRGKSLLSWCGDDNFIVDDDPSSSYEVPFLSMDLHALAAQLSKLKLSQRLFIEADLLPEEMCVDESQKRMELEKQSETLDTSELKHILDTPTFIGFVESEKNEETQDNVGNSTVSIDHEIAKTEVTDALFETPATHSTKLALTNDSKQLELPGGREANDSMPGTSIHSITELKQNQNSRFGTTSAEAELHILLDSFGQSSISSSLEDGLPKKSFNRQSGTSGSLASSGLVSSKVPGPSRNTTTTFLNDVIDDLLPETSLCFEDQKHIAHPPKEEASSASIPHRFHTSSLGPLNASNSSSHTALPANLDDSIDDLLAETSLCLGEQKQITAPIKGAPSSIYPSPQPPSWTTSKPMDDFDSWLDSL